MNKVKLQQASHQNLNHLGKRFSESEALEREDLTCVACRAAGRVTRAIGHTSHPEYRQLALCAECIARYDRAVVE
jgi:hypothetical protein